MKIKINKILIYYIFLLLPIFQPKIFAEYNVTKLIYLVWNISEFLFLTFKNGKLNNSMVIWIIFRLYIFLLILTNYDQNSLLQWGNISIMVLDLMYIIGNAKKESHTIDLLKAISLISNLYLLINFVTLIAFPRGIITIDFWNSTDNDIYFLGIKTQMILIMFPAITSSILLHLDVKSKKSKCNLLFTIFLCLINIIYKNLTTGIVGFILGSIVMLSKTFKKSLTYKKIFVVALFIQVLIIFFSFQNIFSTLITNYLHKDITLSSRIFIWNNAINYIRNQSFVNIIFGTGLSIPFVPYGEYLMNPHSQLLQWIYTNGIIGNILLLLFFHSLDDKKKSKTKEIIYCVCFIELILCTVEAYFDNAICFLPFLLLLLFKENHKGCDDYE